MRPTAQHTVRFACIGDVHEHYVHLRAVVDRLRDEPLTAVLMVGDFTHGLFSRDVTRPEARTVERALAIVESLGCPVFFVPGNHDRADQPFPGNIDGVVRDIEGLSIGGLGGAGPAHFGFPYEWSEDDARSRLPGRCDILLAHAPPARCDLDRVVRGKRHVGSEAIREFADRSSGILVCGHIHEARGAQTLGRCLCYNAGSLGEPHGRLEVGLLEIDSRDGSVQLTHHDLDTGTHWAVTASVDFDRSREDEAAR